MQQVSTVQGRWQGQEQRQPVLIEDGGEETSLFVWFPSTGQCISHVNAHLTYFYLASLFLPSFLFLYLQQFCLVMLFNLHPLDVHKICFLNYSFTCRMHLKCWQRAMNSMTWRVRAWPSGGLHLCWRVCPGRCRIYGSQKTCPAWGNTLCVS